MAVVSIRRPGFTGLTAASGGARAVAAPSTVTITASSTDSPAPRLAVFAIAYGALLLAAVITFLYRDQLHAPFALAMGASAFALFYVAAQGEERLLEPFTAL